MMTSKVLPLNLSAWADAGMADIDSIVKTATVPDSTFRIIFLPCGRNSRLSRYPSDCAVARRRTRPPLPLGGFRKA
jgi:hypothetical protein